MKNLDEIKKKLRNDSGEEDEKLKNELEGNEMGNMSERKVNFRNEKTVKGTDDDSINTKKNSKKGGKKIGDKNKDSDDEDEKTTNTHKKKGRQKHKKKSRDFRIGKFKIMRKFFLKTNIYFFIKVIIILIFSASYYLLVNIMDQYTINNMLQFDYINNAIEGVYKESFMIYLNLKTELSNYIDYELIKTKATEGFYSTQSLNLLTNKTVAFENFIYSTPEALLNSKFYKMNIPNQIETPKIGTLLMPLTNTDLTIASPSIINLNDLYNQNACLVLFDPVTQTSEYNECSNFWSSILLKGMEQSITQMSVVVTSVLDDFNSLNIRSKNLAQMLSEGSAFDSFEKFIQIYLLDSYMYTVKIFRELNTTNLNKIYSMYKNIMIGYIVFGIILFGFLLYFIFDSKNIFNTFMNFIGILPTIYIMEDSSLYKEILKLLKLRRIL